MPIKCNSTFKFQLQTRSVLSSKKLGISCALLFKLLWNLYFLLFRGFELLLAHIYSYRGAVSLNSLDPFHLWTWLHDYTFHVFIYNLLTVAMMIFFVWDSYITSFLPTWFTQPKNRHRASPLIRSTSNGQSVITDAQRNYKCRACSILVITVHFVMGKNLKSLLSFILNKQAASIIVFLFCNKNSLILKSTEILLCSWFSTWKRNNQSGISSVLPLSVKKIFQWHLKISWPFPFKSLLIHHPKYSYNSTRAKAGY